MRCHCCPKGHAEGSTAVASAARNLGVPDPASHGPQGSPGRRGVSVVAQMCAAASRPAHLPLGPVTPTGRRLGYVPAGRGPPERSAGKLPSRRAIRARKPTASIAPARSASRRWRSSRSCSASLSMSAMWYFARSRSIPESISCPPGGSLANRPTGRTLGSSERGSIGRTPHRNTAGYLKDEAPSPVVALCCQGDRRRRRRRDSQDYGIGILSKVTPISVSVGFTAAITYR